MLGSLPKLAWRNLGRNRRRTFITGAALAFGICLCVASYGLVDGLSAQMLNALTKLDLGHVQVHSPEFTERRSLRRRLVDPDEILARADAIDGVVGAAPRAFAFALVSSDSKSAGIELVGVDPLRERSVTELQHHIREGDYLSEAPTPWPEGRALSAEELKRDDALTDAAEEDALAEIDALEDLSADRETSHASAEERKRQRQETSDLARAMAPAPSQPLGVLVGTQLANTLKVGLGDSIYASTIRLDGVSEAVFMRVDGIYQTGTRKHDRHRIYLHIADLRRLVHLERAAHEIAIVAEPITRAGAIAEELQSAVGPNATVRPWNVIRPDMQKMLDLNEVSTDIMVFIIFIVATLGVINTMLMSVFERTRELGVLKAIGMRARHIVALIVSETLLLVLAASAVGTALGLGLDLYMVYEGLDLSGSTEGVSIGGIGINPVIYGAITMRGLIMPSVILSASCLLASLYPAIRAAGLRPAIGMRET